MKLYEISAEIAQLEQLDIDSQAYQDTLESLQVVAKEKAENLMKYIANLEFEIEPIKSEMKRLKARADAIQNRADSLREYLAENMCRCGIKQIKCDLFTINYSDGSSTQKLDIFDEKQIPAKYIQKQIIEKTDTSLLKSDLKLGKEVAGARLINGKPFVTIR